MLCMVVVVVYCADMSRVEPNVGVTHAYACPSSDFRMRQAKIAMPLLNTLETSIELNPGKRTVFAAHASARDGPFVAISFR